MTAANYSSGLSGWKKGMTRRRLQSSPGMGINSDSIQRVVHDMQLDDLLMITVPSSHSIADLLSQCHGRLLKLEKETSMAYYHTAILLTTNNSSACEETTKQTVQV